jgi:hypothetical protein
MKRKEFEKLVQETGIKYQSIQHFSNSDCWRYKQIGLTMDCPICGEKLEKIHVQRLGQCWVHVNYAKNPCTNPESHLKGESE